MTAFDPDEFRDLLEAERARLVHSVAFLERESTGTAEDELGEAASTDVEDRPGDLAIDEGLEEGARQTLDRVDAALRRIDDGAYGTCEVCGKPIGEERLRAIPWAALCIEDQRRSG